MRAIFGVLSLLAALAVVTVLARRLTQGEVRPAPAAASAVVRVPTSREEAQALQQQVQRDVDDALKAAAAARASAAE